MKMRNKALQSLFCTLASCSLVALFPSRVAAQGMVPAEVARYGYADLIVVNAKIVSMDDQGYNANPGHIFEAMAVKDGKVMGLGTSARIRALADGNTRVLDVRGMTVIPGIIDTHNHLFGNAQLGQSMGLRWPENGIAIQLEAGKDKETTRLKVENALKDAVSKVKPGE